MQVNYFGYLYCIKAAFASLCRSKGHLVAITSFSGEVGLPFRSAYCSSKFAVTGLLDSLRSEMKAAEMSWSAIHPPMLNDGSSGNAQNSVTTANANSSFDITIVCPPTINTNLRRNSLKASNDSIEEKPSPHAMTVENCAAAIVDAADRRLRKAFFPLNSFLANYLRPFMPDTMDALILKRAKL
jgi:short-subunit dehydrogenase